VYRGILPCSARPGRGLVADAAARRRDGGSRPVGMGLAALLRGQHAPAAVYALAFSMSAGTVFFSLRPLPPCRHCQRDELIAQQRVVDRRCRLPGRVRAVTGDRRRVGVARVLLQRGTFAFSAHPGRLRLPASTPAAGLGQRCWRASGCWPATGCCGCSHSSAAGALSRGHRACSWSCRPAPARRTGRFGLLLGAIGAGAALGPLLLAADATPARRWSSPYLLRGRSTSSRRTRSLPAHGALVLYGGTSTAWSPTTRSFKPSTCRNPRRVFAGFDISGRPGGWPPRIGACADILGIRVYAIGGPCLLLAHRPGRARPTPSTQTAARQDWRTPLTESSAHSRFPRARTRHGRGIARPARWRARCHPISQAARLAERSALRQLATAAISLLAAAAAARRRPRNASHRRPPQTILRCRIRDRSAPAFPLAEVTVFAASAALTCCFADSGVVSGTYFSG